MAGKGLSTKKLNLDKTGTADPAQNGELTYKNGTGFRFKQEGTVYTMQTSSGAGTAYDDIGDPDANGSISFGTYTGTYTSTGAAWAGLTISNTHSNPTAGANLLTLGYTADGDAQGIYLVCKDNSSADAKFTIAADGATTIAGTAKATDALTLTAGDIKLTAGHIDLTDGDLTLAEGKVSITNTTDEVGMALSFANTTSSDCAWTSAATTGECLKITADALASGGDMILLDSDGIPAGAYYLRCYDGAADDLTIGPNGEVTTQGAINIDADSTNLTFGEDGATDSYVKFDGTDLVFYDSHLAAERTLSQLASVSLVSPTVTGDLTLSDGKIIWTDAADEVAGAWTFAGTTNNDISWSSAVTSANALAITANALTSGSMVYLESSAAGMAGEYLRCYDGAADDFSVGADGRVIIAGPAAGTAAIAVTTGDITLADTDTTTFSSVNGTTTMFLIDNVGGAIADNSAVLKLDCGGTPAAAGSNILRIDFTGTDTNKPTLVEVIGAGKDCMALSLDADPTTTDVVLVHSDAVIANNKAMITLDHATGASAAGSGLLRITEGATPNAGAIAFEIDAQKDMIAMYVDSNAATNDACTITHSGNLAAGKAVLFITDDGVPADAAGALIHAQFTGTATNKQRLIFADGGGKDVTGLFIDADTATQDSDSAQVVLYNDNAGALGGNLTVHHNSASPAANDQNFNISVYGEEATSSDTLLMAGMTFETLVETDGATEGAIKMQVNDAANTRESFFLTDDSLQLGDSAAFVAGSNGAYDFTISTNVTSAGLTATEPYISMTDGNTGDIVIQPGSVSGSTKVVAAAVQWKTRVIAAGTAADSPDDNDGVVTMTTNGAQALGVTLPEAADNLGLELTFVCTAHGGQDITCTRTGADVIDDTGDLSNTTITLNTTGDFIVIRAVEDNKWIVVKNAGCTLA